jgi:hypothetical protein
MDDSQYELYQFSLVYATYGMECVSHSRSTVQGAIDEASLLLCTGSGFPLRIVGTKYSDISDDNDALLSFEELHKELGVSCYDIDRQRVWEEHGGIAACLFTNFAALLADQ